MKVRFTCILTLACFFCFGQKAKVEQKGVLYHQEFSLGFRLNSAGWAAYGDIGKQLTVSKKRVYRIELIELKHQKEFKQPTVFSSSGFTSSPTSKPYYFGKQNSFYALQVGYGHSRMIADKPLKNGVAVGYAYSFGPTLGILKPYYLEVIHEMDNSGRYFIESEKYDAENADKFLDPFSIYGASGFSYGMNEISFLPGIHGRFGLNFDWAVYDDVIKQFEVGLSLNAYYKKVPIMITEKNNQFFGNLYLSFQLGRKW